MGLCVSLCRVFCASMHKGRYTGKAEECVKSLGSGAPGYCEQANRVIRIKLRSIGEAEGSLSYWVNPATYFWKVIVNDNFSGVYDS